MQVEVGVVGHEGGGQTVVLLQPLLQHLRVVVVPPDERLSGDVILAGHSGRVELLVVGSSTGEVEPTTTNSSNCNN